jgi:hypothetical protein
VVVVRPDEPEHRPTGHLAQFILAALLPEHGITRGLAGLQKTPVLDAAVELPQEAMFAPSPIAGAGDGPVRS